MAHTPAPNRNLGGFGIGRNVRERHVTSASNESDSKTGDAETRSFLRYSDVQSLESVMTRFYASNVDSVPGSTGDGHDDPSGNDDF